MKKPVKPTEKKFKSAYCEENHCQPCYGIVNGNPDCDEKSAPPVSVKEWGFDWKKWDRVVMDDDDMYCNWDEFKAEIKSYVRQLLTRQRWELIEEIEEIIKKQKKLYGFSSKHTLISSEEFSLRLGIDSGFKNATERIERKWNALKKKLLNGN